MNESIPESILQISRNLHSQDNLATALPVFVVQQRRRIVGVDSNYSGGEDDRPSFVWAQKGRGWHEEVFNEADIAALEKYYAETFDGEPFAKNVFSDLDERPTYYQRFECLDIWEFVAACFTRVGAEAYLRANGHNLMEPRIYVESGYRNDEWEQVREWLMQQGEVQEGPGKEVTL